MTDVTNPDGDNDPAVDETVREHSQEPAEGPDPDAEAEQGDAPPRVHPEDPAEG